MLVGNVMIHQFVMVISLVVVNWTDIIMVGMRGDLMMMMVIWDYFMMWSMMECGTIMSVRGSMEVQSFGVN